MAKKISLKCTPRKVLGRKVKALRREGVLPVNIYGKEMKSQALQLPLVDFVKAYRMVGETNIVDLMIAGQKKVLPVLIHHPQVDPVTGDFLHVDFHKVSLKEKVVTMIPVELKGKSAAAESGEGVLITILSELEVEALPTDLPDKLEVDISKLAKIDDAVRVKEIKIDKKKVKILADENQIVVKIEKPAGEEEEVKPAEEEGVVEEEPSVAEVIDLEAQTRRAKEGKEEKKGEEGKEGEEGKKKEEKLAEKEAPKEKKKEK